MKKRKWLWLLVSGALAVVVNNGCDPQVRQQVLTGLSSASTTALDTLVQGLFQMWIDHTDPNQIG